MLRGKRFTWRALALLLCFALFAAACGGDDDEEASTSDTGAPKKTAEVVKIGFIAPLSGDLSALGIGMKNSVELAIKQANESDKIEGWRIVGAFEDDQAKADVGATVAAKLASDPDVAAVIGTLNSSVAQQAQPVLDKAGIPMISPANTNPTLTQGEDPAAKVRPYASYFRVATTDAIQGPFAAQYVFNTAGLKSVAIIHDKKTYGQGLSDAFKAEYEKLGGKITGSETINPGDKDFSAVVTSVKSGNPQLVYYGGEYPEASLLTSQMKAAGLNVPLMGGDGIYSGTYMETAKEAAEGDLATSVGAPTDQLDSAKAFISDYEAAGYSDPYEAYGAYAYDAANVIIEALATALPGAESVEAARPDIVAAIQDTSLDGVTGAVAFDEFGDTTTKVLTVYKVTEGAWKPDKTDSFK